MKPDIGHFGEVLKKHFRFVVAHIWVSQFIIYIALLFLCVCQFQNFAYYNKIQRLVREYRVVDVERITLCSVRSFSGKTATGSFSGTNQIALSPDLYKHYKGWYAVIPSISDEMFAVTDLTNSRFKNTVDIYSFQTPGKAQEFGVKKGKVVFISEKGIELLGGM